MWCTAISPSTTPRNGRFGLDRSRCVEPKPSRSQSRSFVLLDQSSHFACRCLGRLRRYTCAPATRSKEAFARVNALSLQAEEGEEDDDDDHGDGA